MGEIIKFRKMGTRSPYHHSNAWASNHQYWAEEPSYANNQIVLRNDVIWFIYASTDNFFVQ
jgi:hypothetical protein